MTQKISHDKTAKPLPELLTNQAVRLQTDRGHEKIGYIKDQCNPRSYTVSSKGKDYRRNRQHPLPVGEPKPLSISKPEVLTQPGKTYAQAAKTTAKSTAKPKINKEAPKPELKDPTPLPSTQKTTTTTRSGRQVIMPARYTE